MLYVVVRSSSSHSKRVALCDQFSMATMCIFGYGRGSACNCVHHGPLHQPRRQPEKRNRASSSSHKACKQRKPEVCQIHHRRDPLVLASEPSGENIGLPAPPPSPAERDDIGNNSPVAPMCVEHDILEAIAALESLAIEPIEPPTGTAGATQQKSEP